MKKIFLCLLAATITFPLDIAVAETAMERLVKQIVSAEDSNDSKMYEIEKWVIENIQYTSDKKQFNMMERWTLPYETLQRRRGDCEDGAILLIAFAATAGVPTERLRLYAPIRVPNGWHACVAYQRESDDGWVWMEWALKLQGSPVEERRTIGEMPGYAPYGTYLKVTSLNPFHMVICRPK
jgi:transglutaminase-like putative cysteine protease